MSKTEVVRMLVRNGFGLPQAIDIYNRLSNHGFYELTREEVRAWIRKNGY